MEIFMKTTVAVAMLATLATTAAAQLKVGNNPATIQNASLLELETTNKGLVLPRVSLTGPLATNPAPLATDILEGTTVFNTNTGFASGKGIYIWKNGAWETVTPAATAAWNLTGNAGTDTALHFVGTSDNQPLVFRTNNQRMGFLGRTANGNIAWGLRALNPLVTGSKNVAIGALALASNTSGAVNTAIGDSALYSNTTGVYNIAMGRRALFANTTGTNNIAHGQNALFSNTEGGANISIGYQALYSNTTGSANIATGFRALESNTTGWNNIALGQNALGNDSIGENNVAIGFQALFNSANGSNNTAIGNIADVVYDTLNNATAIGWGARVGINNGLVLGDSTSGVKVGIGTGYPTASLHVKGSLRMVDGSQDAGRILTSDAEGNATWQSASASAWGLTGNAGTDSTIHFVGTTDARPLIFKVNGVRKGYLGYSNGNISFGNNALNPTTTGTQNTALGFQALAVNSTGAHNIANGYQALNKNTSGSYNVAIGEQALFTNTAGANNVGIGQNADVLSNNLSNATALGLNAKVGTSNAMVLGDSTSGVKVGIGTGYPQTVLHVRTTSATNAIVTVGSTAGEGGTLNLGNSGYGVQRGFPTAGANNHVGLYTTNANLYLSTNGTSTGEFVLTDAGNVGIGTTTSPGHPLVVQATGTGLMLGFNNSAGTDKYNFSYTNGGFNLSESGVAAGRLFVQDASGNVGVGTTNPTQAKLVINGTAASQSTVTSFAWLNSSGTVAVAPATTRAYSLYTSSHIWCAGEINVTSDIRTKTLLSPSSPLANLELVKKLQVIDYQYKDQLQKGSTIIKGFSAQQVESIYPEAVSRNTGVIPNIYQKAVAVAYHAAAQTLSITMAEKQPIAMGDKVKLITAGGESMATVADVRGNSFTISNWPTKPSWVFIYGTEVPDLRNLDYNKIFSAGIGAIQQLATENEELKKRMEALEAAVNKTVWGKL